VIVAHDLQADDIRALCRRATAIAPDAMAPRLRRKVLIWAGWLLTLLVFVAMCRDLGLSLARFATGAAGARRLFAAMWPPSAAHNELTFILALGQTLGMAFLGTVLTVLAALPLALLGARTVVRQPLVHFLVRRLFDLMRVIPSLVWALILVAAFGLGPRVGVVAIVLAETPAVAKIFAEILENRREGVIDSLRASGAGPVQIFRYGLLPQVLPVIVGMSLLLLESNVRTAAGLGLVGAGGIGVELQDRIQLLMFDQVAWIMILFIALVIAIDALSQTLRRRLIDDTRDHPLRIETHA
jgi:phosphonate transport system permease protein